MTFIILGWMETTNNQLHSWFCFGMAQQELSESKPTNSVMFRGRHSLLSVNNVETCWNNMGVSRNGGSPKTMVFNIQMVQWLGWFGGTPNLGNFHIIGVYILKRALKHSTHSHVIRAGAHYTHRLDFDWVKSTTPGLDTTTISITKRISIRFDFRKERKKILQERLGNPQLPQIVVKEPPFLSPLSSRKQPPSVVIHHWSLQEVPGTSRNHTIQSLKVMLGTHTGSQGPFWVYLVYHGLSICKGMDRTSCPDNLLGLDSSLVRCWNCLP